MILHVQPYNPNEPKKPRRSSAESAIQNNHNSGSPPNSTVIECLVSASTERGISGEYVIEESTISTAGSPKKSLSAITPIRSSSPIRAPTPVAQTVVNMGFISAPNQSPSERYYLTSER